MSKTLFLRLQDPHAERVAWRTDDGAASGAGTPADVPAELRQSHRIVILAPGADVLLTRVRIPVRNRQQLRKALPYALEDTLVDDVETLHFVPGRRDADGHVPVAVVARQRIEQWLGAFESAGIRPDAMVPDVLAMPKAADEWTLVHEDGRCLVRTGSYTGVVTETANLGPVLQALRTEPPETPPSALRRIRCAGNDDHALDVPALDIPVIDAPCNEGTLATLCAGFDGTHVIDLLQGLRQSESSLPRLWRAWRPAGALLALWVVLHMAHQFVTIRQLENETATVHAEIEQLFRRTLPDVRNLVEPRQQLAGRLKQLRARAGNAGPDFIALLGPTGQLLNNHAGLTLTALSYSEGALEITVTLPSLQTLDTLKQQAPSHALSLEIEEANAREEDVFARLRITRATS